MTIFSYGQSVYMHEAQQEAEENEISFGETILGAILFFGVIYVISKLSYRKSDSEHNIYQISIPMIILWMKKTGKRKNAKNETGK